jgi:5-formyltetrahydrofolate cyclo-ligase
VALPDSLRATLRAQRRAVPLPARARAGIRAAAIVDRTLHLHSGQRIALFASVREEIDTQPLIERARSRGCIIYLPRVIDYRTHRMRFVRSSGDRGSVNRFGILEPSARGETIAPRWLDIVFLPLVAFDASGTRLGMGGGFYDRAFAFRRFRQNWRAPLLVGMAYSFQQVHSLHCAPHDVKLDAVVTEERWIRCSTGF